MTLENDVARLLHDAMHRSRRSLKDTLNTALRSGLTGNRAQAKATRFVVKARPLGLRAGIDPTSFNQLADELEVEAFQTKTPRKRA